MMDSTFSLSEVLRWAASITGKTVTQDRSLLIDLIRETIDVLHAEESTENLRKWCIPSSGCLITIPPEMESPVKYKIGNKVGPVRNFTYQFQGYTRRDCSGYQSDLLYSNESPIFFDLPPDGARVACRALELLDSECKKEDAPYLLVQGYNTANQQVSAFYEGKYDLGERISIASPDGNPEYSEQIFKKITSIRVVGDINTQLIWCNAAEYGSIPTDYGLLAIYDRGIEYPAFRRYELPALAGISECYDVEVLGNIRKPLLKYDNDLIRGYDSNTLRSMLRAKHYQASNDLNGATFNSNMAMGSLRKQKDKQLSETDFLDVFQETAAANFPKVY